jgi:O-antigen biosynthesis rhamnosyltransferase
MPVSQTLRHAAYERDSGSADLRGTPHDAVGPAIRVLHLYKSWSPDTYGGVERVITTLSAGGRAFGIESRVAYLAPGRQVKLVHHHGVAAYRFPLEFEVASTGLSLAFLLSYRRLAAWADVLHFHFPWPYGDLVHRLSGVTKPFLVTYHLDITRQRVLKWFYAPLRSWFFGQASRVIATSQNYLMSSPVLKRLPRTRIIPLGIEDEAQGAGIPLRQAYWRHRLGAGFVLFVGVLRYYKGLHLLLAAASSIHSRIVIAGTGPCEQALKRQAQTLGLTNVSFLGEIDQLDKDTLYRLSAVFVFPSHLRSEAFGLSLVEAAMYGKPLVSCEIGTGTTFVNVHELTGLVVEPGHPEALSSAVNRLLNDRRERDTFGRNARNRYLDQFTAERMVADYAGEYRAVLMEQPAWKPSH